MAPLGLGQTKVVIYQVPCVGSKSCQLVLQVKKKQPSCPFSKDASRGLSTVQTYSRILGLANESPHQTLEDRLKCLRARHSAWVLSFSAAVRNVSLDSYLRSPRSLVLRLDPSG